MLAACPCYYLLTCVQCMIACIAIRIIRAVGHSSRIIVCHSNHLCLFCAGHFNHLRRTSQSVSDYCCTLVLESICRIGLCLVVI